MSSTFPTENVVIIPDASADTAGLMTPAQAAKLDSLPEGGGLITADDITETDDHKVMTAAERTKLAGIEEGAEVNDVTAVFGRAGAVVATTGDYTADQITDGSTKVVMTGDERTKLAGIAEGAQTRPAQVTSGEKTAGDETTLRSFSPADIKDMAVAHGGGGSGSATGVISFASRTGAVTPASGDYDASQINETSLAKIMTAAERTKLAGIETGAQVNVVASVAGKTGAISLSLSDVSTLVSELAGKAALSHTHSLSDVPSVSAELALRAPLASPALTGTPTAPTPTGSDNSTKLATTAFVKAQGYLTAAPVTSVAGKTGVVSLVPDDVGLGNVANEAQLAKALTYTAKSSPAAGDKLVIKDQTDGQPKMVDWNQLPTVSGGTAALPDEQVLTWFTNGAQFNNVPAAIQECSNTLTRKRPNLANATKLRASMCVSVPQAGRDIILRYSTLTAPGSLGSSDWTTFAQMSASTATVVEIAQFDIPAPMQSTRCWLAPATQNGDSTGTMTVKEINLYVEKATLKGAKGDPGDPGTGGSSATTRQTMTAGGDPPDVDCVIVANTAAVTINMPNVSTRNAISFLLAGTQPVTFQGGSGRTLAGGAFTASPGGDTAPVNFGFVRDDIVPTKWRRWVR